MSEDVSKFKFSFTIITVVCVLLIAATCSGLNIGLLGIDPLRLETYEKCGEPSEQSAAKKVKLIMEDRHLLLCALLFFNALCMTILPMLLNVLLSPQLAVLLSITGILFCGEIVPQAICNKYGLQVGAFLVPLLWVMIFTTFAVIYPLARFLDKLLGPSHIHYYERKQLEQLVLMHTNEQIDKQHNSGDNSSSKSEDTSHLETEEATQIQGAIKAASMTIKDVLTDIKDVTMLPLDTVFDQDMMNYLYECGHSRIPIYEGNAQNIIGVIHVKQMIMYQPKLKQQLNRANVRQNLVFFEPQTRIFDALNQFQTGKSHLGIVRDEEQIYGIVTLEDLVELILQTEIFDEEDNKNILLKSDQSNNDKQLRI
ncbi:Conserved_hypothetical protein [Hexamita inflata]|uniref:Uncharacterized protein n=1 Tax=Hexamita inflata TaxID=28002 RepID=A0AA86N5W2_9EUKA|nr:Conserved hypothetical protein [Hexamita inflata]